MEQKQIIGIIVIVAIVVIGLAIFSNINNTTTTTDSNSENDITTENSESSSNGLTPEGQKYLEDNGIKYSGILTDDGKTITVKSGSITYPSGARGTSGSSITYN